MNCPVCNVALVMAERHSVEIDYCPKCRGIWLDRGELDKIIERVEQQYVVKVPVAAPEKVLRDERNYKHHDDHDYDKHHDKHHHEHRHRKSFLRELFD